MTQDDIIKLALIKLAQESGFAKVLDEHASEYRDGWFENSEYPELLAFVKLVAAVERESCAKVCDALNFVDNGTPAGTRASNRHCAAAIRARGEQTIKAALEQTSV